MNSGPMTFMNSLFASYFFSFLHPFQIQEKLNHPEGANFGVDLREAISVSWSFAMIRASYSLLFVFFGLHVFFSSSLPEASSYALLFILARASFFPVGLWAYSRLWFHFIQFFARFKRTGDDLKQSCEQLVSNALSVHGFYLIPILGNKITPFAFLFYLYAGLRKNLQFSIFHSLAILALPFFFLVSLFLLSLVIFILFILLFFA